jgi:hypothetical protein
MTFADFWNGVGPLLAGALGGIGSVAVAAFTKFGDRLADYLVSQKIATFKHGLETQIEQLKARLAHFGDRGVRSNELEYAATIASWEHFVDAYIATYQCVISYLSHPDFSRMTDDEVRQYIKTTEFSEAQQEQMLGASDRNRMYSKITELRLIGKAGEAIFDARSVLRKQGIFIPKELEDEFENALKLFSEVQVHRSIQFQYGPTRDVVDKQGEFAKDEPPTFEKIKEKVRARILLSEGAASPRA